jgi:ATP-binding protein involved in chromosome partitioning
MLNEKSVLKALSYVNDPDLNKDLVTLNMIKDIIVGEKKVTFTVVLTTPACPMKESIQNACINAIHHFIDKDIDVNVNMTANVTSILDKKDNKLKGIKNIVAIASGKGGVGKSTLTSNLAIALSKMGAKVGIIDADIYGPSIPIMFGLNGQKPGMREIDGKAMIMPLEKFDIKILSIGLLINEDQAVVWRGPMVTKALNQFFYDCDWGELDYLLVDLPPGTGDIQLSLAQMIPVTGAVFVTTPQNVAIADVIKSINMFKLPGVEVSILGIVENMAYFTPEDMPEKKYYIFGKNGGKELAKTFEINFLGQIPLVQDVRKGGDEGNPITRDNEGPTSLAFKEIAQNLAQQIAIKNANFANKKENVS